MLRDSVFLQRVSSEDFFAIACLHLYFLFDFGLIDVRKLFHFDNKDKQRSKVTMTTSPESTVALAALTAVTIRQQVGYS
jgi:hypothetical protein